MQWNSSPEQIMYDTNFMDYGYMNDLAATTFDQPTLLPLTLRTWEYQEPILPPYSPPSPPTPLSATFSHQSEFDSHVSPISKYVSP